MTRWHWRNIVILALLILGVFLLFARLGDRALWDDEAQTAVLGRQVLKFGLPKFMPEENLATDRADLSDYNGEKVFIWNTWLPYYLTAASFAVLGESEWAARLPFAFFGLLSLLIYCRLSWSWFKKNNFFVLVALSFLVLSVPFLLHTRQCRYYALIVFGTLWMIWGYLSILNDKKWAWVHLAAAGVFCFYSFYAIAGLNLAGIWLHGFLRERRKNVIIHLSLSTMMVLIAAMPAIWYMHLWSRPAEHSSTIWGISRSVWVYLLWINGFILPFLLPLLMTVIGRVKGWPLLVVTYGIFLWGAAAQEKYTQLFTLAGLSALLFIYVIIFYLKKMPLDSTMNFAGEDYSGFLKKLFELTVILGVIYISGLSVISPYPFFRYITPLIPLMLLLEAAIIINLMAKRKYLAGGILVILIGTNFFSSFPLKIIEPLAFDKKETRQEYSVVPKELWRWTEVRFDMVSYWYEITHPVTDPEKEIVNYLRKDGSAGQIVKASYGDISLMFYRPQMRIISRWDAGGGIPDYVIKRSPYPLLQDNDFLMRVRDTKYREKKLAVADVVWSNNPDPLFHRYKMPPNRSELVIFRKVSF